ncbi:hypothetical protein BJY04DRAFT_222989 [Aspergillus karnatakaensis]|uniref:Hsp70 family protein n=1 Tax=Aspergillus karnatakaensis TaxID=1810916 RepID=UPI003CCCB4A2
MPAPSIIVGLDFGTTYSGIAWALGGSIDDIEVLTTGLVAGTVRCQNLLPQRSDYLIIFDRINGESSVGHLGLKLLLDEEQEMKYIPSMETQALLKAYGKDAQQATADFLRQVIGQAYAILQRRLAIDRGDLDPQFVLTVPPVWSDKAKDATLRAAVDAGLKLQNVSLVSEPEAAALYALRATQPNSIAVSNTSYLVSILLCKPDDDRKTMFDPMDPLRRLLGFSPPKPPSRIETDEIYPVHLLDDTKTLRGIVVTWTLRFNDVLDADKLHASLSRLLEIGDWRKVGGRLRLNEKGRLEIHSPNPFTPERPAVSYSHRRLPMPIEEHALARTLPKATNTASIQPGAGAFQEFAVSENAPATLEDYIYTDTPQLSLLVTSFTDATLVGLSWPHTLMDVMGQQALLHAWSLVVAGREDEVPPLLGARSDELATLADAPDAKNEDFLLKQKQLRGLAMLVFVLRFLWDMLWDWTVETRTVFLPKRVVDELLSQARRDLAVSAPASASDSDQGVEAKAEVEGEVEGPFISEGDVLTAWTARAIASSQPRPCTRPITILQVLNARFRLPSLLKASGVYIQNLTMGAFALVPAALLKAGALGPLALAHRRLVVEQCTEGQVLAIFRELRHEAKVAGEPVMVCGEANAALMVVTNWTRADVLRTTDFSGAVVRAAGGQVERVNPLGTPVFHFAGSMRRDLTQRNVVVVLGKDHGGGYWLTGMLSPRVWAVLQREVEGDLKGL